MLFLVFVTMFFLVFCLYCHSPQYLPLQGDPAPSPYLSILLVQVQHPLITTVEVVPVTTQKHQALQTNQTLWPEPPSPNRHSSQQAQVQQYKPPVPSPLLFRQELKCLLCQPMLWLQGALIPVAVWAVTAVPPVAPLLPLHQPHQ